MPIRSLSVEMTNYLMHGLPNRPPALDMLMTQGRIVTRKHKRDLLAEIDRYKRASTPATRPPLLELWNWVNGVQFPPHGARMKEGRYVVFTVFSYKKKWHVAMFNTEHDSVHTSGYGVSPETALADLARTYQLAPTELHIQK
jgi:hypothetical protein